MKSNQDKRFTMTCPACAEQVYLDPMDGWRNDSSGFTCKDPQGHAHAVSEKLGRAFHEAGIQMLTDSGLAKVILLPPWKEVTDLQRMMVYAGVTAVLMESVK